MLKHNRLGLCLHSDANNDQVQGLKQTHWLLIDMWTRGGLKQVLAAVLGSVRIIFFILELLVLEFREHC